MKYDYYSCPYKAGTGAHPCGDCQECTACSWHTVVRRLTQNEANGERDT